MKRVLLAAIALSALSSEAFAHSWSVVSYAYGKCETSHLTPEMVYRNIEEGGTMHGLSAERISPDDVNKDSNGDIHVHLRVKNHGQDAGMDFFSSARACNQFVKDNNIKADQANSSDIN